MSDQINLFGGVETPASRKNDDWTSHEAEREITRSGRRRNLQRLVLKLVAEAPGLTGRELHAKNPAISYENLHKRLPELVTAGKIRKGDKRHCAITGRKATTWVLEDGSISD